MNLRTRRARPRPPTDSNPRGRRRFALLAGASAAVLAVPIIAVATTSTAVAAAPAKSTDAANAAVGAAAQPAAATTPTLWSTQLDFDNNGTAWSEASFAALKADGLTEAELDMPWGTIEPSAGTFTFTELDQELANASAAGIKLVPIFWESGWGGSPAPWISDFEVSDTGATGVQPAWWDPTDQSDYLAYVTDTVKHIAGEAGYGGSILDYGFLDAQWDVDGGAGGWAADDVNEFHNTYLPQTYGSISAFNSDNGTSYSSFSQVPAADPGQTLGNVYQLFRDWSVQTTYGLMTADVRAVTSNTPLYYYFGGHIGNAVSYTNIPDIFFALAKQYTVTVIEDAANSPGLVLLFGSLGRAYGVPVAMEWTAPSDNTQLAAQAVQWIDNYGMALPEGGGEDFFIHDGTEKDTVGFPIYTSWVSTIKSLSGSYPSQPVAVYVDLSQAYGNASGGNVGTPEDAITSLWDSYQAGFAVVTSQEVNTGIVKLSQYKAVLPMNGVDANLNAYKSAGGTLLTANSQLAQYAPAYASLTSSGVLQVVPVVASSDTSAQVTLGNVTSGTTYDSGVTFDFAGLGLTSGSYHVVNASGATVPQAAVSGGVCATADVSPASLAEWNIVSGAIPSGTAAPSGCSGTTSPPPSCGTLTANQSLGSNQSLVSCNGEFSLTMQSDGNLVLYQGSTALWASNTVGSGADEAIMQGDGNFVLYTSSGSAPWASGTAGNSGAYIEMQNDANLVIYSSSGAALWASNTAGK